MRPNGVCSCVGQEHSHFPSQEDDDAAEDGVFPFLAGHHVRSAFEFSSGRDM